MLAEQASDVDDLPSLAGLVALLVLLIVFLAVPDVSGQVLLSFFTAIALSVQ